jgi:hypothetical protein
MHFRGVALFVDGFNGPYQTAEQGRELEKEKQGDK